MRPLFDRLTTAKVQTYSVVLSAVGIAHQVSRKGSGWSIAVEPDQRAAAIEAVSLYLKENPPRPARQQPFVAKGTRTYSALYIAAILALIHILIPPGTEHERFVSRFGADAAHIVGGELYRCATALLLHADITHLLGNLAGLIIFGTATASLCGWGLGWAMILAAGFAGNLVTAWWYGHDHLAIGASTAVFGAIGICTALSLWNDRHPGSHGTQRLWRRWLPLAGGLALLGLLGTSPHADLMAHLSGFALGLALGGAAVLASGYLPYRTPAWLQWTAAVAAGAVVAACWLQGMGYKL
jgi:membrane associated rhomboid family serine protease